MKIKIGGLILTIGILTTLILTGPAKAFTMDLIANNINVLQGELINFQAKVNIDPTEFLEIDYFVFDLNGPSNVHCMFDPDGNPISGCQGITIQKIKGPTNYSYGYGFTDGEFIFNITIDTIYFKPGDYDPEFKIFTGDRFHTQAGGKITINPLPILHERCSVRSELGNLIVENQDFGNNVEVNFYVPAGNANNGEGSVAAQYGRNRFSYKFDIINVINNDLDELVVTAVGEYRIGRGANMPETSIIIFDKVNNLVEIQGPNVNLDNSNVWFREGC